MKNNLYTLIYAGILSSVCACLLTAASVFTKPLQQANSEAEKKQNILHVLKVPFDLTAPSKELLEIFKSKVIDESSEKLEIYRFVPVQGNDSGETFAVAFEGAGVWGPIKGFLALQSDMQTIRGITFYEQEETPGLGGEIATEKFRQQFTGKVIVNKSGEVGITIGRDVNNAPNGVNAITGATMTCDKVEVMLNEVIMKIIEENKPNEQ